MWSRGIAAGMVSWLAWVGTAGADGGAVVGREIAQGLEVTVFAAPVPLRTGPVDVSVLVQDADGKEPILDAEVWVGLSRERAAEASIRAEHGQATNRLLYAALLGARTPGPWWIPVRVESGGKRVRLEARVVVEPGPGPMAAYWPWLALPLVVIVVFLTHQWRLSVMRGSEGSPSGRGAV